MLQIKKDHIEILIYALLSGTYIQLIGSLSLSEVWVFGMSIFIPWRGLFKSYPLLKKISLLYLVYFTVQIVSELLIQNSFQNLSRGLMVTVVSYLVFIFLFNKFRIDPFLIVLFLIGIFIRLIVFRDAPTMGGTVSNVDFTNFDEDVFKFRIVPLINAFLLIISYFLLKNGLNALVVILFFFMSIIFIYFDSRSSGMMLFACSIFILFAKKMVNIKKSLVFTFTLLTVIGYIGYIVWINSVLNMQIGGVHSYEQAKRMDNPYNPFELLLIGRNEFAVGLQAFSDKPLLGHGAWTQDVTGKYFKKMLSTDEKMNKDLKKGIIKFKRKNGFVIPVHSVLLGAGVNNGIFALFAMALILWFFLIKGFKVLPLLSSSPFAIIFFLQLLILVWDSFFSPLPHFRLSMPITFALILAFYYKVNDRIKENILLNENNNRYSNLQPA